MSTSNTFLTNRNSSQWNFLLIGLALIVGLGLSILSWLELCIEHCSANKDYRLFGLPFAFVGIAFFTLLVALHFLSQRYQILARLVGWTIASALGAEAWFVLVQKYQIGQWCPVCLGIAASVAFAALVLFVEYFKSFKATLQYHNRGEIMQKIKKGLTSLSFVFFGFLLAFIGISKMDYAEAAAGEIKEQVAFGKKDSPIEVYFVTDWFCPSCKKVEPDIEKVYPEIRSKATFYFIDYPIHQKSLNYTPYNLAFLINNKPHYFKARQALSALAEENESPNDEDIVKATKKEGLKFKELSFLEVRAGMDFFDKVTQTYDIKATPTLIITNIKSHKTVKLEGTNEITAPKILEAINSVSS